MKKLEQDKNHMEKQNELLDQVEQQLEDLKKELLPHNLEDVEKQAIDEDDKQVLQEILES